MGVKTLTYTDLSPKQRQEAALKAREKFRGTLMSPFLTQEQVALIHAEIDKIDRWEKGTLHDVSIEKEVAASPLVEETAASSAGPTALEVEEEAPSEPRKPVHHAVSLVEKTDVKNKVS